MSRYEEEYIGKNAGIIYKYLIDNTTANLAQLRDSLEISYNDIMIAIGWLQRESKLKIIKEGNKRTVKLALRV